MFHEIFCATKIWSYRYINQLLKTRFKIRQTEIALKETPTLKLGLTLVMTVTQNCVFVNLCRDCHATSSIAYTLYCASAPFLHRESTDSLTTDSENLKCSCAYLVCRKVIRPKPDLPDSLPWMLFRNVWPQVVLFNFLVTGILPTKIPCLINSDKRRTVCISASFILFEMPSRQAGFSLEIYFQMLHNISIGRYERPSLHTAIEMLSGKSG